MERAIRMPTGFTIGRSMETISTQAPSAAYSRPPSRRRRGPGFPREVGRGAELVEDVVEVGVALVLEPGAGLRDVALDLSQEFSAIRIGDALQLAVQLPQVVVDDALRAGCGHDAPPVSNIPSTALRNRIHSLLNASRSRRPSAVSS